MNTELRNKLFNKMKDVFENEDTQEREAFLQAREEVDRQYEKAHRLAVDVVSRSYPPEDVAVLRTIQKEIWTVLVMLLQKINAFTLHTRKMSTKIMRLIEVKSHFDFGLFGNLNGSEYGSDEDGKKVCSLHIIEKI